MKSRPQLTDCKAIVLYKISEIHRRIYHPAKLVTYENAGIGGGLRSSRPGVRPHPYP